MTETPPFSLFAKCLKFLSQKYVIFLLGFIGLFTSSGLVSAQTFSLPSTSTTGTFVISWSGSTSPTLIEEYQNGSWGTATGGGAASGSVSITKTTSGTYTYRMKACTTGQSGITCNYVSGSKSIVVTLAAPPTVNVSFSPNPVVYGQNSTLTWSSTGATSCSGAPTSATSGSMVYPITVSPQWSYTITCTGPGGSTSATAILQVNPAPAPTVSVSFSPNPVMYGSNSTLTWSSTGATSCSGAPTSATSGSMVYPITVSPQWSYTITCTGPGGSASGTAVLQVNQPVPTVTASFNPKNIVGGQSTTFSWSSTNATSCSSGFNSTSGSMSLTPSSTTTQTVTCTGPGGSASASDTVYVTNPVKAPTVTASFSPKNILLGQSTVFSWSSTDATSCSSGFTNTSGNKSFSPTNTLTQTVSCTGPGGTTSASDTVTVAMPTTATTTYEYDDIGRLKTVKRNGTAGESYQYDAADNRTQKTSTN